MKKTIIFTAVFLFLICSTVSADLVQVDVLLSNYGYGAGSGVYFGRGDGIALYFSTTIRGANRYTRAGLRYYWKLNSKSLYGSLGYVNRTKEGVHQRRFDVGTGVEFDLGKRSALNIEGGYSSAVPSNIYYIISLRVNWL